MESPMGSTASTTPWTSRRASLGVSRRHLGRSRNTSGRVSLRTRGGLPGPDQFEQALAALHEALAEEELLGGDEGEWREALISEIPSFGQGCLYSFGRFLSLWERLRRDDHRPDPLHRSRIQFRDLQIAAPEGLHRSIDLLCLADHESLQVGVEGLEVTPRHGGDLHRSGDDLGEEWLLWEDDHDVGGVDQPIRLVRVLDLTSNLHRGGGGCDAPSDRILNRALERYAEVRGPEPAISTAVEGRLGEDVKDPCGDAPHQGSHRDRQVDAWSPFEQREAFEGQGPVGRPAVLLVLGPERLCETILVSRREPEKGFPVSLLT